MKMYLASYKLGEDIEQLKSLLPPNKKTGYIANALDFSSANKERVARHINDDMKMLEDVGMEVENIDLKEYFGKTDELREKIMQLGILWISGGNVFVLRQAMKLSGLDKILLELRDKNDFLYGAYSAGVCVLSPSLKGYHIVDDPNDTPYEQLKEALWDGLGIINFTFLPHFESDHPESNDIGKELTYCKENNLPYKALKDGEVIIID